MATRPSIPAKVSTRMTGAIKNFQKVLSSALARDVNESDTVTIVTDMLGEVFGYDKYHEVTSEHEIRSTYCDLAIEIEGQVRLLIEVKAIGLDLKDKHLRQAINYAANQGIEWVVLTNGVQWQVYRVDFGKPVTEELIVDIDMLSIAPKDAAALECLYLITREGVLKGALPEYYSLKQATSRFIIGAILLGDRVVAAARSELKKVSPGVKISPDQLRNIIRSEVLKREVSEGEKAEEAGKKVQKCTAKVTKAKATAPAEEAGEGCGPEVLGIGASGDGEEE